MNCPKCSSEMVKKSFGDLEMDRCGSCKGTWLDAGESKRIIEDDSLLGRLIDNESSEIPTNAIREGLQCPHCARPLEKLRSEKFNLVYEGCLTCNGIFLDAGELRRLDLANPGSTSLGAAWGNTIFNLSPVWVAALVYGFLKWGSDEGSTEPLAFAGTAALLMLGVVFFSNYKKASKS